MQLAIAGSSASYKAGEYAAVVCLAVLLLWLLRRLSVNRGRSRRSSTSDALAAVVVAALLLVAGLRIAGGTASANPWAHGDGAQVKAGFMEGCQSSASGRVDCGCVFTQLTSRPPYNTPKGFETLAGPMRVAQRTRNLRDVPPAYIAAVKSCVR